MAKKNVNGRNFWIVSPNVGNHSPYWSNASLKHKAAFMGYSPNNREHKQIGYKFAHSIRPNDILLIARRYRKKPQVVGFGVVVGEFKTRLKGFQREHSFGSLRKLRLFKPLTATPPNVPIMDALGHHTALRKLHPNRIPSHRLICDWMERSLGKKERTINGRLAIPPTKRLQLTLLHSQKEAASAVKVWRAARLAQKREATLVNRYREWLGARQHKLWIAQYPRCDAYEKDRGNLIEAKCSAKREYIRMAVGQLFDYAYLGRERFGKPNMA
ncbi:MAG: hypothetical protein WBE21_06010, partial [Candidatus Acidiferrales bacterium]